MDSSLVVTVGLIFLVTLAAGYVRSRLTDRCLRSFDGFNVTLQKTDGKLVWGRMGLSSGGMEFTFPEREGDESRLKTSYLLYAGEYKLIQAIVRDVLALVVGRVQKMQDRDVDALVDPGGTVTVPADDAGRVRLRLETVRDLDMIVPRSRSAVRHRAERAAATEAESVWDVVFDLGTLVRRGGGDEEAEARLRRALEQDPPPPAAAARLGALLLKKQDFAEAGRWLRVAYQGRETLPDGGRRVRMQLRELARRLAQRAAEPPAAPVTARRTARGTPS